MIKQDPKTLIFDDFGNVVGNVESGIRPDSEMSYPTDLLWEILHEAILNTKGLWVLPEDQHLPMPIEESNRIPPQRQLLDALFRKYKPTETEKAKKAIGKII